MKIAPLILIHFVENCFKHGLKGDTENTFVEIDIVVRKGRLTFHTKNNVGVVDEIENNNTGGKGLANAQKRLDLIYGEHYQLNINSDTKVFDVHLTINLEQMKRP